MKSMIDGRYYQIRTDILEEFMNPPKKEEPVSEENVLEMNFEQTPAAKEM